MADQPSSFHDHDHDQCVATALSAADAACAAQNLRLTPVRRRTLEILLEAHEALGAYDVLARLDAEGFGSKPPVAYRALTFLVEAGLAHRIERLNAFVACARPDEVHDPAFLICNRCGIVAEGEAGDAMSPAASATGFQIDRTVVEATGVCPACQDPA
ncbi:Fur family transcriptional regulator [Pseudooctadecabacter jejudonensis]|uniref:Zinc uptake regulation protein n=1 Tax=Pseudooctadecabacter jejudonensis TaxID=1391910 RepID=A0A1Y5RRC9_9RHOB|nr:Fur family transcriptional regulator [Pseudooctadecabacter jejudonensis]SLN23134.1 Zinc uptake regulation protein [Pseudooctadecabacter jejudonensis]